MKKVCFNTEMLGRTITVEARLMLTPQRITVKISAVSQPDRCQCVLVEIQMHIRCCHQ